MGSLARGKILTFPVWRTRPSATLAGMFRLADQDYTPVPCMSLDIAAGRDFTTVFGPLALMVAQLPPGDLHHI